MLRAALCADTEIPEHRWKGGRKGVPAGSEGPEQSSSPQTKYPYPVNKYNKSLTYMASTFSV